MKYMLQFSQSLQECVRCDLVERRPRIDCVAPFERGGGWTPVWDELPIARKLRGEREELQNMIYFRSRSLGARFEYYKKVRTKSKNPKI